MVDNDPGNDPKALIVAPTIDREKVLSIPSTTELDTARLDPAIVKVNQGFNQWYRKRRREVIDLLRQAPAMIEVVDQLVSGKTYQAVIPPEVRKQIKQGKAVWDQSKEGLHRLTIRDAKNGQIICQVKLEDVYPKLMSSLNQLAVQRALAEIIQKLEEIDQKICTVLEGQRNDRLALVESGVQLYLQAMAASKPETRHQLLIEAVDKLTVGRQQLILSMEANIHDLDKRLPRNSWQLLWRSLTRDMLKQIEEKAKPVQESLQAILRASYVLASTYQALDEPESLQVSLYPLRETLLEIGTKGEGIARWLPYDIEHPPEELWHNGLLQLADAVALTDQKLESLDTQIIEIPFETKEMTGGIDD